jgi:ISXO2 transposase-like protein
VGHSRTLAHRRVARYSEVTIEGFFGHFKTDARRTHHSISRRWLDSYLNEWVWKWNHRDDDEAMLRQLLSNAAGPV